MAYNTLKFIHILTAAAFVSSLVFFAYQWTSGLHLKKNILTYSLYSIVPLLIFQLFSGFTLISLKPASTIWVATTVLLFLTFFISGLLLFYCLLQSKYRPLQLLVSLFAFSSMLGMIFLMVNKV